MRLPHRLKVDGAVDCTPTAAAPRHLGRGGGGAHLRAASSLMRIPDRRVVSLTLGSLLYLVYNYHCRHRLYCMRDISECLRIDQDTGS